MIQLVTVDFLLKQIENFALVDVRSPGEYDKGHIPGAVNIPVFSDEERALVGKTYKQKSTEKAIELGYQLVQPKLEYFVERVRKLAPAGEVMVHCWRGGMRSRAFAEHLIQQGVKKVYLVEGGYKAYRNYALDFFKTPFDLKILGGYTGSGKTEILHWMAQHGHQVIDLEGLAHHRGSAFGGIDLPEQPTTEQFENDLFTAIFALDLWKPIWIEDESNAVGRVNIPKPLFLQMSTQRVFFLDIPQHERAKHLVETYAGLNTAGLAAAIGKIGKRLGFDQEKRALQALEEKHYQEVAEILLYYYDKYYLRGVSRRDPSTIIKVALETVNTERNAAWLMERCKE
jgi:tRNA 2-selenouridine synthase